MGTIIVKVEKIGKAAKLSYDDGTILYTWSNGRYQINDDNDLVEAVNTAVPVNDHFHKWKFSWSEQEEKYGTSNADQFCEYLIRNGIFFSEYHQS